MARRKRRVFTPDFKAAAVRVARVGERNLGQVAKDLDLTETALQTWVKQTEIDAGKEPPEALTTAKREEIVRMRYTSPSFRDSSPAPQDGGVTTALRSARRLLRRGSGPVSQPKGNSNSPAPRCGTRWPRWCSAGRRSRRCSACWWRRRFTWCPGG